LRPLQNAPFCPIEHFSKVSLIVTNNNIDKFVKSRIHQVSG